MPVTILFFFNDTATTEIYTLSLHDALPISIFGGSANSSGAFSISALATFPDRCASRPASSANASKMANVVGPSRMPNQAIVVGSCCTKPCPSGRYFGTLFSLPGFASSLTSNAFVVMSLWGSYLGFILCRLESDIVTVRVFHNYYGQ